MRPAVVLALVVALGVARAAPARGDVGEHEAAVAAFEEARRLIEAGDCTTATKKLHESLAYEPSIGAHLSYASCVEAEAPLDAYQHLRDAALLAYLKHDERLADADARAAALLPRVAAVVVDVPDRDVAALGFELRIDDRAVDRFHVTRAPIGVSAGEHFVEASTADGRRWADRIVTSVGTSTRIHVALVRPALRIEGRPSASVSVNANAAPTAPGAAAAGPTPPAPASALATTTGAPTGRQIVASGVAVAGVLALAVGSAYGIVTLEKRSELDRACGGDADRCTGSPRVVDPVLASAEANATASNVLLAIGGALVVAAGVLFFTAPARASAPRTAVLRW